MHPILVFVFHVHVEVLVRFECLAAQVAHPQVRPKTEIVSRSSGMEESGNITCKWMSPARAGGTRPSGCAEGTRSALAARARRRWGATV